MHGNDRTTRTAAPTARTRTPAPRTAIAVLAGALVATAPLHLTAPRAEAAVTGPATVAAPAAPRPATAPHPTGTHPTGTHRADCPPERGYRPLFDGTSLDGWRQAGPGSFTLGADGTLTSSGGMGLLWYAASGFTSYSLKLDWRMSSPSGDDNSGVFVGFPPSDDPWSAVDNGYEIQIDATDVPDRTTGAVYGFRSADLAARDRALNPPGEWNTYEIRVEGERLRVRLNGVWINDYTNTDPARSLRDGHLGLQNHGADDQVSFRDVRIKQLPARGH